MFSMLRTIFFLLFSLPKSPKEAIAQTITGLLFGLGVMEIAMRVKERRRRYNLTENFTAR